MNNPLDENFKTRLLDFYKRIDQKYFVFKIEDLINSIDEEDYLSLINMIEKYDKYRADLQKEKNEYFVVNRKEFPRFEIADNFFAWLKNKKA